MSRIFKQESADTPIVGSIRGWKFGCWPRVGSKYKFGAARIRCVKINKRFAYFAPDDYYELDPEIVGACSPDMGIRCITDSLTSAWIANIIGETIHGDTLSTSIFGAGSFYDIFSDNDSQLVETLYYVRRYLRDGRATDWVVDVISHRPNENDRYECIVFTAEAEDEYRVERRWLAKEDISLHFRPLLAVPLSRFVNPDTACATLAMAHLPGVGEVVVGSEVWANCVRQHETNIILNHDDLVNYDDVTTLKIKIVSIRQSDFESSVLGHCDWGNVELMRFLTFYATEDEAASAVEAVKRSKKIPISELPNLAKETLKKIADNPELLDLTK